MTYRLLRKKCLDKSITKRVSSVPKEVYYSFVTVAAVHCKLDSLRHELIVFKNTVGRNKNISLKYNDVVRLGCKDGYETFDETNFVCQANKTWNGTFPQCKGTLSSYTAYDNRH